MPRSIRDCAKRPATAETPSDRLGRLALIAAFAQLLRPRAVGDWKARNVWWTPLALVLLVMAFASHWPIRKGFFQLDDFLWLHLSSWQSVLASFIGSHAPNVVAYRPIFRVSAYIDLLLFGEDAIFWHFENVVIHSANSLMLAVLLRAYRLPVSICCAAAALFVWAPLSSEAVNYISARPTLLCGFFTLVSLWRWTLAMRGRYTPWAAGIWMLLAAMTYEAAAVLPGILLCLVPLARKGWGCRFVTHWGRFCCSGSCCSCFGCSGRFSSAW